VLVVLGAIGWNEVFKLGRSAIAIGAPSGGAGLTKRTATSAEAVTAEPNLD
jgi:hypothetical protein